MPPDEKFSAEDAAAVLTAIVDQSKASLKEFAGLLGTYFKELMTNGFTRDEALTLVAHYQNLLMATVFSQEQKQQEGESA